MEIVKIRMQIASQQQQGQQQQGQQQQGQQKRLSAAMVVRQLGFRRLYQGSIATLLRDVPFSLIFFPLQAKLKLIGKTPGEKPSFYAVFWGGIVAGALASALVTPADVVKTRYQATNAPLIGLSFRAETSQVFQQFGKIWREEGITAFFKGAGWRAAIISVIYPAIFPNLL